MFSLGWLGLLAWRRREAVRAQGNVRGNVRGLAIGSRESRRESRRRGFERGSQKDDAPWVGGFSLPDSVVRIGGRAVEVDGGTIHRGFIQRDAVLGELAAVEQLLLQVLRRVEGIVENLA